MKSNDIIEQCIYPALDEMEDVLPDDCVKSEDMVILGNGAVLDSMSTVALIIATEEHVKNKLGVSVVIADEKAMSQRNSPFRTVKSLADYITTLI